MNDLFYKLLILRTPGIGPVKYNELIRKFGSVGAAADSLLYNESFKDSVKREIEKADKLGIIYLSDEDSLYPHKLREIKNHPPILTLRGNISVFKKTAVSMVGTRHATGAGIKFISGLATSFAENNHVVVSGMAIGTDTGAHNGALQTSGDSQTIAVLAGGVDYIWPLENESLYNKIIERGAIISEMPVGMIPVANNFIQRNRWVAGICEKLILGEADLKSGSMTTARFAIEYGREVYAIPSHPSDQRSFGPNKLIKEGRAKLCTGSEDFFDKEQYNNKNKNISEKKEIENELLDKLGIIPMSESVLAELVKKSVSEIKGDLVVLELQGKARKQDGGYVRI
ncbi:MAG: DNA-processing protein DprA [Alphaproteobacteria bacterium]|nr:DNA-processing protein DprA [Alphaproteobacteria bacterium]MBN2675164.1 DNA-processing protein DprA [Alphaproteobacteria bacterium]